MDGKECFRKIEEIGEQFFHLIYTTRDSGEYKDTENGMFESPEVGSVTDYNVSVRTTTITEQIGNDKPTKRDVVVLNVNDACDEEMEVLLSKEDCLELITYLSTAAYSLRSKL